MASYIKKLTSAGLFSPAYPFVAEPFYEVMVGSFAYGVSNDSSDLDILGICIPSKKFLFPHTQGYIHGFGQQPDTFNVQQLHHIQHGDKMFDVSSYAVSKFFDLASQNNPNILETLYVPERCVSYMDGIGRMLRENRDIFLHKGSYQKFKGYAYSQLNKIQNKTPVGKRVELVEKYGFDTKFAYHVVRLTLQAEQILTVGTMDLEQHREQLKAIRRGDMSLPEIKNWFMEKEKALDNLYLESKTVPHTPNMPRIKTLLINIIEQKYGSISHLISEIKSEATYSIEAIEKLEKIKRILNES